MGDGELVGGVYAFILVFLCFFIKKSYTNIYAIDS
jgi:hypothetical protein